MARARWVEQQLLDRMRKAGDWPTLQVVFKDMRALRLDRYHTELRKVAMRSANRIDSFATTQETDATLDHIEAERVRRMSRRARLTSAATKCVGEDGDKEALLALLGHRPRHIRRSS